MVPYVVLSRRCGLSKVKKIWLTAGAVAVVGAIIFFSIKATRKDEVLVQTSKALVKDELQSKVSASGQIRAKEFVDLQAEVTGVIDELLVREGDRVQKGDVLLKIDPIQTRATTDAQQAQYEAQLADARAQQFQIMNAESSLAQMEANLRSAQADAAQSDNNFARAQSSFNRKQQLNEDGLISRDEYEQAQNDLKLSRSQLEMAKARLSQAEAQVNSAKNNIEQMKVSQSASANRARATLANLSSAKDQLTKTVLRAPLGGVITQLPVTKGERAVPGTMFSTQATLMTIADLSVIQAELKVDETDIVNLALGNPAKIKVDALPDTVFEGEVTEIGNSPMNATTSSSQQEAKDFKVIVTLKVPSDKLRPGMSCTGDIITNTKKNTLVIPIQALTVREVEIGKDGKYVEPDLTKKSSSVAQAATTGDKRQKKELEGVFVIKDKVARFRPVKAGITGETDIEVLDNLKEGEEVISGSFQTLRTIKDGAAVKIDNNVKSQTERKG
jgi:HlyD family secretion protein